MKVCIVAVNEGCEEREKNLFEFLSNELKQRGIETVDSTSYKDANRTVLVYDARTGTNPPFSAVAKELYRAKIKPILLTTRAVKDEDYKAYEEVGNLWLYENPKLQPLDLYFDRLFFLYEKMSFESYPESGEYLDIDALIEELNNDSNISVRD